MCVFFLAQGPQARYEPHDYLSMYAPIFTMTIPERDTIGNQGTLGANLEEVKCFLEKEFTVLHKPAAIVPSRASLPSLPQKRVREDIITPQSVPPSRKTAPKPDNDFEYSGSDKD